MGQSAGEKRTAYETLYRRALEHPKDRKPYHDEGQARTLAAVRQSLKGENLTNSPLLRTIEQFVVLIQEAAPYSGSGTVTGERRERVGNARDSRRR
ncbi:protein of unknown function (plasmid) [Caballeronia sp. S22]